MTKSRVPTGMPPPFGALHKAVGPGCEGRAHPSLPPQTGLVRTCFSAAGRDLTSAQVRGAGAGWGALRGQ